jgi:hypothetical protein
MRDTHDAESARTSDPLWHHHGHGETESRGGRKVGQYGGHSHTKGDEPHVHSIFGEYFPGGQDPALIDGDGVGEKLEP